MLVVNGLRVIMVEIEALRVFWTIEPTAEDLDDYAYSILRSGSPQGPFELIAEDVPGFQYVDSSANNLSLNREYYYVVRVTNKKTTQTKDFGPINNHFQPDAVGLELIRMKNVYLQRFTGLKVAFLKKKTFGQYCPNCWDDVKQRKTKSNCQVCFQTGFAGGYWNPISGWINENVPVSVTNSLNVSRNADNYLLETSSEPELSPGDMVVFPQTGKRYRIVTVTQTTRMGAIISQVLQTTAINPGDVEYNLKV